MSEVITAPTSSVESKPEVKPIKCGRFSGMLGRFQLNSYNTLLFVGMNNQVAHKVSVDFGSDLGRLMASDAEMASKVGKASKNGESRITIKGGGKIANKYSMSIVRLAQQILDLYKEGLLAEHEMPEPATSLQEYLTLCKSWATEQVWEVK